MGDDASAPAICQMHWAFPVVQSLPWFLLAGVLWIERRQQQRNRLTILVLGSGLVILWALMPILTFIPSQLLEIFGPVFQSLLFGIALMTLLSTHLVHPARGATFLRMLAVTGLSSGLLLYALIDRENPNIVLSSFFTLLIVLMTTLASLEVAARFCRRRPCLHWFVVSMMLSSFVLLYSLITTVMVFQNTTIHWLISLYFSGGFTLGIILTVSPILALWFLHPTHHSLLTGLLHLPEKHVAPEAGATS
jgi:hypothetical protein